LILQKVYKEIERSKIHCSNQIFPVFQENYLKVDGIIRIVIHSKIVIYFLIFKTSKDYRITA